VSQRARHQRTRSNGARRRRNLVDRNRGPPHRVGARVRSRAMSITDLTNAIISGINAGGEQFLEGTLAAVLPLVWLAILGLHLGRPYILDMIDRFTLRLGADLLWLVYIAARDLLIVSGVVMSFMFFFPDVVITDSLPITGG